MKLNAYQRYAMDTAKYPNIGENPLYPALGLGGEVGELLNKLKKVYRDRGGLVDEATRLALISELGDVLWYVAAMAFELHTTLAYVANANIHKLAGRRDRGTISGSGDNR